MKITYEMYQDMQKRFDQYVKDNNKDPEKIYLPDKSNFIYTNDLIALSKIKHEEFPVDYSNTNTSSTLPAPANKSNLDKLRDKFGYFDTICGFYDNIVRKCNYSYYYNQANSAQGMIDLLLRNGTLSVNCFSGDTEIVIKNNDTSVYELTTIKDLSTRNIKMNDYSIPSINKEGKFDWVDLAWCSSTGFNELFEINLGYHNKLTVTEDHPIFTSNQKNNNERQRDLYIKAKTSIKYGLTRQFYSTVNFKLDEEMPLNIEDVIIGFWLGDGYQNKKNFEIRVLLEDKINFLDSLFKNFEHKKEIVKQNEKIYTQYTILDDHLISTLNEIGKYKSNLDFLITKNHIKGLFCGLLASDGNVRFKDGRVKFSFSNMNKKLNDIFALIAKLLGFNSTINIRDLSKSSSSFTNDIINVVDFTDNIHADWRNLIYRSKHDFTDVEVRPSINDKENRNATNNGCKSIGVHETFNLMVLEPNHAFFAGFNSPVLVSQCTDWSVLTCYIAKELGYPFRVYNVVCSQGAGHVRPAIIDKNNPGDWISTDPAAISDKSDRRYNCINDVWCDTNNGSTIVDASDKNCLLGWMHW